MEKLLPFPQYFLFNQITVSSFVHIFDIISLFAVELDEPKIGISGKGLTLYNTISTFNDPKKKKKKALENIVRKGENAGNQHFLLFPQFFLLCRREKSSFRQHVICHLHIAYAFNLVLSRILSFGKGLKHCTQQ